ncbi:MAG TPA: sugar transferase [Acidimicrobiales bacterium]|nr:sugar transferase [Acidimicrobiales bacterium]
MGVAAARRTSPASAAGSGALSRHQAAWLPPIAVYVAADVAAMTAALVIAHLLRFGVTVSVIPGADVSYVLVAVLAVPVWVGVLALARCYDRRVLGVGSDEYRRVLNAGVHFLAVVAVVHFLLRWVVARGYVGVLIPVAVVLTVLARFALRSWLYRQRRRGRFAHRVVLVGTPVSVIDVGEHLVRATWSGFEPVGVYAETEAGDLWIGGRDVPVLGPRLDPDGAGGLAAAGVDAVAVTADSTPGDLRALANSLGDSGVELLVAPAIADVAGPRTVVRPTAGLALLHVGEPSFSGPQRVAKEAMDRVGALLSLIVLAPLFLAIAVAVKLDTPGPVFFRQTRVGKAGHRFAMVKFRTMVVDAERLLPDLEDRNEADGLLFKLRADPRVTRVGRWLRRYSLDELPQLLNVLKGDMSLVGPRPPLPAEVDLYESHVTRRLLVKPGMTGLWQVSGRSDLSWEEAIRLDLHYVDHWSPTMDLAIIVRTFSAVLRGAGAY